MQTNGFPLSLDHEPPPRPQLKATPPLHTHTDTHGEGEGVLPFDE